MVETTEAKQVCRAASTVVYPALNFDIKPCGRYTREDFLEVLSRVAFEQEFANTAGKTCQLDYGEPVDVYYSGEGFEESREEQRRIAGHNGICEISRQSSSIAFLVHYASSGSGRNSIAPS